MNERQTVREGYNLVAETYADQRTLDGAGRDLAEQFATALPDGSRVLDAGAGSGGPATVAVNAAHDVAGLDISRGQLHLLGDHLPAVTRVQG